VKKHVFSAHSNMKTWLLCKIFLVIGAVQLIIYILQIAFHFLPIDDSNTEGALLGFAILFLGLGLISYFFSCQFAKLSNIAEEIENDETLTDEEPIKE
jgi:hypothetical protein